MRGVVVQVFCASKCKLEAGKEIEAVAVVQVMEMEGGEGILNRSKSSKTMPRVGTSQCFGDG